MSVSVRVCGRLRVEWDGERLEEALTGRQVRALFAYLTLHRDRPVRRDELVEALWSGAPPSDGDALLRPLLSRLRRALGPERLTGRAELALAFPPGTWVDWEAVQAGVRDARERLGAGDHAAAWQAAHAALEIAEGGLLPGLDGDWIERLRTELEELRGQLLETVGRVGARLGDAELVVAEHAARRAVALSPYRESARAALIEVLRRRGNAAEAMVAYDEIRTLLRDELGSLPGPELRALHAALLQADAEPTASPPAARRTLPDRLTQAAAPTWVGRDDALARLRAAADRAATGETTVLLVTGDGGIGKTRLVAELAASLPDFDVLYARCDEEELFPYGPWVDLLRPRLARLADGELAELLGAAAPDLARLLPEIAERLPSASAPARTDPETERRQLFVAVTEVVRRLAGRGPLLAVIDDLHWADRSSLLLARHAAGEPQLGPVLMLGTFRDTELHPGHPLPELIADLERHRAVPRIHLGAMDEGEVTALVGSLHAGAVDPGTVRAIRAETGGNPFFVKQLVRHLEEGGQGLETFDGLVVPQGVRDVIARRVSRLPHDAGQVLRVAALLGRDFDFDLLAHAVDLDEDALLDVLDAAVRGGLLAEMPTTAGRYSFAHALLRTTLEAELSRTRRARLHARIGAVIESRHHGRLEPWLNELARHFGAAGPGEAQRAVEYAVRAAEQATRRLAYDESARLLHQAVELSGADRPAELARLEHALATAQSSTGDAEAARASFARSAAAARATDDAEDFARAALGHSGATWEHYGRADPASARLLEEALDLLPDADSALRVRVLARLAVVRYFGDGPDAQVEEPAFEAVARARRVGDRDALIAALVAAQFARWRPGGGRERLALADELVAIADGPDTPNDAAEAHLWRAIALLELCRLDEADVHIARHAGIAERVQHVHLLIHRDAVHTTRVLLEGDYEAGAAAVRALQEWIDRERAHGRTPAPNAVSFHVAASMSILHERGELGRLAQDFEQLEREMTGLPGWRAALSWAHVQAGAEDQGRTEIEALSADAFAVLPRDANFVPALAMLAHAVDELDDGALAAPIEPLLAPHGDEWVLDGVAAGTLGPVAYSLGVLQLAQGRAGDAIASFEHALERSERMRARPYVARSQARLARALRLRGGRDDLARAEALEGQAGATARELGMLRLERELAGHPAIRPPGR